MEFSSASFSLQAQVPEIHACSKSPFRNDMLKVSGEGLRSFCRLLCEQPRKWGIDVILVRHRKITVPASAHISGVFPPTIDREIDGEALVDKSTNLKLLHRVAALEGFYGSSKHRLDTVLVTKRLFRAHNQMIEENIDDAWHGSCEWWTSLLFAEHLKTVSFTMKKLRGC